MCALPDVCHMEGGALSAHMHGHPCVCMQIPVHEPDRAPESVEDPGVDEGRHLVLYVRDIQLAQAHGFLEVFVFSST